MHRKAYEEQASNPNSPDDVRAEKQLKLDQILLEVASIKASIDELS